MVCTASAASITEKNLLALRKIVGRQNIKQTRLTAIKHFRYTRDWGVDQFAIGRYQAQLAWLFSDQRAAVWQKGQELQVGDRIYSSDLAPLTGDSGSDDSRR
eukprot:gene37559-49160_t